MQSQLMEEDLLTIKVISSNQNTRGEETMLSAELYNGDKKVDPRGTNYIYEWSRSSNEELPIYFATGKHILVKPEHISHLKTSFGVTVRRGMKEKETVFQKPSLPML